MSDTLLAELKKQLVAHKSQRDLHERLVGIYEDALEKVEEAYDEAGVVPLADDDSATTATATKGVDPKRSAAMKKSWEKRRKNVADGKTTTTPKKGRGRAKNAAPLIDVVQKILSKKANIDGLKLGDLVEEVVESGWETTSTRPGGLAQIVYQSVHKLMNTEAGKAAVIVKDKDSKRYKLRKHPAA